MKIGFLITARMKSTRLPKKLTLEINGRQIIRWMIDRLKLCSELDKIIICTSTNPQDNILEDIAKEESIEVFRGSEDDVIQRLYDAAKYFNLDYVLNITADCPLVSVNYISKIIGKYKETKADLIRTLDLPHGFYSYGISVEAMEKVCEIKKGNDTEVWGRYFTDTGLFNVIDLPVPKNIQRPKYRLTLDYEEDFLFLKQIYEHFGADTYKKDILEIISFLDSHKKILEINADCEKKYTERWNKQNKLEL